MWGSSAPPSGARTLSVEAPRAARSARLLPPTPLLSVSAGRGEEVLRQGGPAALFAQGGWKGVSAWGYAGAQAAAEALTQAEAAIELSDSSEDEAAP